MSHATNVKITRDDERWEIEIKAEIPAEELAAHRTDALKHIAEEVTIDGFRQGKAPEAMVLKHVGEAAVLEHAAEHAVKHALPEILAQEKANIVESPRVAVATPEAGKPLAFTARAALAPEITLADYKKIASDINKTKVEQDVSDEEHADALKHLKRERARIDAVEKGADPKTAAEDAKKLEEKDLPAIDDEFARALGYDDAKAFEDAVRENMKGEKNMREAEKRRASMLDELVKRSTVKYPVILRDYELEDMEARMAGDVERMGMSFEKFLEQSKKTREDLHKEWLPAADNRAKVRLVLAEIARKENIDVNPAKLDEEVARAKEHYKNADESALRSHIAHAMRNELIISWLESQE